ncbi:hypothetical protein NUW54_g5496 [Trametes sanguinea]|uniref:Uncharacterized protein n=1 Tax=Trametes sanguinea TaxID=158606 RepID=A0ACC1PUY7_9APHY|nr:hypothetical protein NUW54_g5496 [Trametes sanguinea]
MAAYSGWHPAPFKLFQPMLHIPPRGIIAAFAILSAANITFIIYLFHMLKGLVPAEREYSEFHSSVVSAMITEPVTQRMLETTSLLNYLSSSRR